MFTYSATVYRVVDGDTVDLTVDLGFSVHTKQRFRLQRINAPEKNAPGAAEATAALQGLLPVGAAVSEVVSRKDKYGRYLAEITAGGVNVSDALLALGLVAPYKRK